MINMFLSGEDFHTATAKLIAKAYWGIEPHEVKKYHRSIAKCFHPDTEVLTKTGWKLILDLASGEEVLQATPRKNGVDFQWVKPLQVYSMQNEHDHLVHLKNEGIDLRVTPDHRMVRYTASGFPKECLPKDIPNARTWPNAGMLDGNIVVSESILRLAVAAQADGSINHQGGVRWGFTKKRKIARLTELLTKANIPYTRGVSKASPKNITWFHVNTSDAAPITNLLDNKMLPWWWLDLTIHLKNVVLDELPMWDGHKRKSWSMFGYYSTIRQNVDVAQALAATAGRKSRLAESSTSYRLSVKQSWKSRGGNVSTKKIPYKDLVACLAVPSSYVLARDGKSKIPVVTGQSFNFGLLYGMTDKRLAKELGISLEEAKKLRQAILGAWKKLAVWIDRLKAETRRTGYCWTWWDGDRARRRPLYGIRSQDGKQKSTAENSSVNTPVQGTASDYMISSICDIVEWILHDLVQAKLVLTVHDSVVLEVHETAIEEVVGAVLEIMTGHNSCGVPLKVDVEIGNSYGDLKKYKKVA